MLIPKNSVFLKKDPVLFFIPYQQSLIFFSFMNTFYQLKVINQQFGMQSQRCEPLQNYANFKETSLLLIIFFNTLFWKHKSFD